MEITFLCQCKLHPPSSRLITSVQTPALSNSHLPPPLRQPTLFVTKIIFVSTCLRLKKVLPLSSKNIYLSHQVSTSVTENTFLRRRKSSYSITESFLFYWGEHLPLSGSEVDHRPRHLTTLLRQSPASFVSRLTSSAMLTAIRRQMAFHSPRRPITTIAVSYGSLCPNFWSSRVNGPHFM